MIHVLSRWPFVIPIPRGRGDRPAAAAPALGRMRERAAPVDSRPAGVLGTARSGGRFGTGVRGRPGDGLLGQGRGDKMVQGPGVVGWDAEGAGSWARTPKHGN